MNRTKNLSFLTIVLIGLFFPLTLTAQKLTPKEAILKTGEEIRAAFAKADLQKIEAFHHPEVEKALAFDKVLQGREAVIEDLKGTLKAFKLEFVENEMESLLIQGDVAIEQSRFAIKGTPIDGGEGFVFRGRTMVTYVRYAKSPTGWASIREIIQLPNP